MNVIGYIRVSPPSQLVGTSLVCQKKHIADFCLAHGWKKPAVFFREAPMDSRLPLRSRRTLAAAVDLLVRGQAQVLVCAYRDRITRSVRLLLELAGLAREHQFRIVSACGLLDTDSAPFSALPPQLLSALGALDEDRPEYNQKPRPRGGWPRHLQRSG